MAIMEKGVPLKNYTTMRLGGPAQLLATASNKEELASLISQAESENLPLLVLGAGSNIIVGDDGFKGMVVLNRIVGFEVIKDSTTSTIIKTGSGVVWDELVQKTVDMRLSGIENLSSIPGYVGAAPIQNIGAYGQEIADTLLEVEAYDLAQKKFMVLSSADCDFSYRKSTFNSSAKGRYIITSVTLELTKKTLEPPFYDSLQRYLSEHAIIDYSPASLRKAVRAIRAVKLPDPTTIANSGSFFKNPLIEKWQADELKNSYPDVSLFAMGGDMFKVSAGWLIEECGLKGLQLNGMKVYDKNALVLVNENASSYKQLAAMRDYIIEAVHEKFKLNLLQEPEEIGVE